MRTPKTIQCTVVKKSKWQRPGDNRVLKSISLDVDSGRYFGSSDEDSPDYEYGNIKLSIVEDCPAFFDDFKVGQKVELEVKPYGKR